MRSTSFRMSPGKVQLDIPTEKNPLRGLLIYIYIYIYILEDPRKGGDKSPPKRKNWNTHYEALKHNQNIPKHPQNTSKTPRNFLNFLIDNFFFWAFFWWKSINKWSYSSWEEKTPRNRWNQFYTEKVIFSLKKLLKKKDRKIWVKKDKKWSFFRNIFEENFF